MIFEFCSPPCCQNDLQGDLLDILNRIEINCQMRHSDFDQLYINSAYRSPDYEKRHGRDGTSAHCLSKAVDISCKRNDLRYTIVKSALQLGINRIGIYKNYIHLDTANFKDKKSPCVIWYG